MSYFRSPSSGFGKYLGFNVSYDSGFPIKTRWSRYSGVVCAFRSNFQNSFWNAKYMQGNPGSSRDSTGCLCVLRLLRPQLTRTSYVLKQSTADSCRRKADQIPPLLKNSRVVTWYDTLQFLYKQSHKPEKRFLISSGGAGGGLICWPVCGDLFFVLLLWRTALFSIRHKNVNVKDLFIKRLTKKIST